MENYFETDKLPKLKVKKRAKFSLSFEIKLDLYFFIINLCPTLKEILIRHQFLLLNFGGL